MAGIPFQVLANLHVDAGQILSLAPGTELQFESNTRLTVAGVLDARGDVVAPITFTGVSQVPAAWQGVHIWGTGLAILRHCTFQYGGASGQPLLYLSTGRASLLDSRLSDSAADAVRTDSNALPALAHNRIAGNAFGVRNNSASVEIDARGNWWGDPTGPYHPIKNPAGLGDPVSDRVLFDSWLTAPPTITAPVGQLVLTITGPERVGAGDEADYVIRYKNLLPVTVENAVLLASLPTEAEYIPLPADALYWPEKREVFWRLGDLPPEAEGTAWFRVRFHWGVAPHYRDRAVALLAGSNVSPAAFDVAPYLTFALPAILDRAPVSAPIFEAERLAYPNLDLLYNRALADGFLPIGVERFLLDTGAVITHALLLHADCPDLATLCRRPISGPSPQASPRRPLGSSYRSCSSSSLW